MAQTDWRRELVEAYADLFRPAGHPPRAPGWPWVGDGWRDLLERACVRIRAAIRADDAAASFGFSQIKEKFGTLRIYAEGALSPEVDALVEEAIDLAEARSATTCEVCGEPGRLYGGGWLTTRCAAHAEDRPPVEVEEGFENLHVERRTVGGRIIVRRRFYDRDTDSFVEVPPRGGEEE
jgi:hypothetical protein